MKNWINQGWKLDEPSVTINWGDELSNVEKNANPIVHKKEIWEKVEGKPQKIVLKKFIWDDVKIIEIPSLTWCVVDYFDTSRGNNYFFQIKCGFTDFKTVVKSFNKNFGVHQTEQRIDNDRGSISYYDVLVWIGPIITTQNKKVKIEMINPVLSNHISPASIAGEFTVYCE